MLHFQIDTQSGVPVYRQIVSQIKYYVASGALKAGDLLPSIRELAQSLAVNPTTVVRAYSELEQEKVLEMQQGRGAFVADAARRMTAGKREQALRRLARQLAVEAVQLGAPGDLVAKLVQEELEALQDASESQLPARLSVVGKR
ncbi:MAG TPA: GntR family transcriptional regulator [Verrucomicrobiae bacterium]|nr:GntR family transcriptional regulator [Verrucomicrobiae bacterium]